ELNLGTFRFQTDITFLLGRFTDTIHKFPVDSKFYHSIHCNYIIGVPLAFSLGAILNGFASLSPRVVRHRSHPSYSKQFSMNIRNRRLYPISYILVYPVQFQHLNLHSIRKPILSGPGTAPNKGSGVSSSLHMPPLHVHDKIFILFFRADHTNGKAPAYQKAILVGPSILLGIDIIPFNQGLFSEDIGSELIKPHFSPKLKHHLLSKGVNLT